MNSCHVSEWFKHCSQIKWYQSDSDEIIFHTTQKIARVCTTSAKSFSGDPDVGPISVIRSDAFTQWKGSVLTRITIWIAIRSENREYMETGSMSFTHRAVWWTIFAQPCFCCEHASNDTYLGISYLRFYDLPFYSYNTIPTIVIKNEILSFSDKLRINAAFSDNAASWN